MNFEANIDDENNRHFHLYIKSLSSSRGSRRPKTICFFISISEQISKNMVWAASVDIRYMVKTCKYIPLEKLAGLNESLFDLIVEKLEDSRPKLWGL